MRLKQFIFALTAMLLSFASPSFAQVAKVGNTEYATIDEAVANWTNGTTLTLLANVTLSDVVTLKSTEHHILNLGTYTMTAASGKNAFVIQACGTGDAERSAITINADATNPGGINAGSKCVVYYKYADGGINTNDRPIIKINGGVFTGSTSSWGTAGIYTIGTEARKCATVNVAGGTFNCSIVGSGKSKLIVSGGVFNYTVSSQGDSTCSRLISGGTFKTLGFMTADSNNTKFWIGTSMGNSNVGVHIDDNGYLVVGGPVVTAPGEKFEASSPNHDDAGFGNYLTYSSAATEGLYYTSVEEALADNNNTSGSVTVYVDELDMTGISYKGTIVVPAESKITITNAPATLVVTDENGNELTAKNGTYTTVAPTAKIGDVEYATLAEAAADAQAGDEIVLLGDVTEDVTLPAGVKFNGNDKAVGNLIAGGDITFTGVTKAVSFSVQNINTTVNIVPDASLEITGTGRMAIGHGCTFNITGTITDAKTADVAALTPSLIMPGASFTGAGVTFNVKDAYIKTTASYCSSSKSASGTFDFNIENSIWEQFGKLAFEAQSTAATVNFELKNSVLNTTSHLVFGVSRGEVVIDNSNVNVGTTRQIENRSTMTIKNGSVVNGAVATSSNAINPGTIIVENATYSVTGEFSGAAEGTGTLVIKKGANVSVGSIKAGANVTVDAEGMTASDVINFTANLSQFTGTLSVINNDKLEAQIVDGKIVLAVKPVAKIGETKYATLEEAFKAATAGCTIDILSDVTVDYAWDARYTGGKFTVPVTINGNGKTIKFTGSINDNNWNTVFRFGENATVNNLTVDISNATGAQRVISAQKSLNVDGLKIVGEAKYGVIYGEGASAADLAATEIVVKNSTLDGTRRALSDNEGGKDVKSVVIEGNTFNANVYVSAFESIAFNNNTVAGETDLRSYAADNVLNVQAQGNTLATDKKNYIYAKTIVAQDGFETENPPLKVATKAELNAALAAAKDGDVITLTADIDYGTDQLAIAKAITLDLGGKTLTTRNAWGGMSIKNNPTVKNGNIVHASNTAAIKVWNATAFEDLVIDVQGKGDANKTIGGIVLQSGSTTRVGSIKNVTIKGAALTNGIETYNCGDATENVIGSMENVTIDALGTGLLISAPCGTATNCDITGGVNGVEIFIKGNYSASLDLVNSKVDGGVYAHDEFSSNPSIVNNGTLNFTADAATTGASAEDVTLEIARAEADNVKGVLNDVMENAQAKLNNVYYATLDEAFAAAAEGATITLLADATPALTSQRAITKAAVIDLGGNTLTLTEDDLYFGTTTFKNGTIVVDSSVSASTAVFWMFANQTLTFDDVDIIATGLTGTYLIGINDGTGSSVNLLNGSSITIDNSEKAELSAVIADNGNGNSVIIKDSNIDVKNVDARLYLGGQNGSVTIENSDIVLNGVKEGFYLRAGQALAINGTSNVDITLNADTKPRYGINMTDATATYTKAETATVNATVYAPATGSNSFAYTKEENGYVRVWGEGGGNAKESYELKLYSGETLIATTKLNNVDNVIDGDVYVTWNFYYPESNDEYWTTTWEEGHPNSAAQPTKVELYIDGTLVATTAAKMSGADDVAPVVWRNLGGVAIANLLGEGTETSPYLISNKKELMWLQAKVDKLATDGSTQFAGKYFKLTADIDLTGVNWNPIGSMSGDHGSFKGVFDGGDHTISNLKVEQAGNGIGLFARTTGNAVIKNLKLNNVSVKSTDNSNYVGAVVGNAYASTKIENVHVSGNVYVSGRGYIGGIAGHGYVVMDNVSVVATGDGQGNDKGLITSTFWCAGGILGYGGEGATNIMNANVENVVVTSAAGGLGAIVGMAEDNNGTQPISGSNLSAKDVEIKTYTGAYGDSYANYALGYLYGGNPTSKLTGELSVENVTLATSNGVDPTPVDAVAKVNETIYFSLAKAIAAAQPGDVVKVFAGTYPVPAMKAGITIEGAVNADGTPAVLLEGTLKGTLENLTLKNLHIKGGNAQRYAYANGNLVFENVTFEATSVYALHFDGINEGTNLLYKDCTIIGWAAMGGSPASCVFEGCTIKDNGTYGVIRTYFDATIKDCTFDVANANTGDIYQDGIHAVDGAEIAVNGCTNANGEMKDLVNVSGASVVTVDGVEFKNVAKIGDSYYATINEAIAAIGAGDVVIELLDNATFDYNARDAYGTAETTSVTINGNGKTLTLNQKDSDWASIGLAAGKLVLKDMTIEKTGYGDTSGAWNTHAIIFSCPVEMTDVTVNNGIAVQAGATLNNVTINEANGYYGLWVNGNGQTVTVSGGEINATNGGRGIKVADEYIASPVQVTLNVTDTEFNTAKKAAVLVTSTAGAKITASNVDIANVAEDNVNFVWVDEDRAANYGAVEVTGAAVAQESVELFPIVVKNGDKIVAYFKNLDDAIVAAENGATITVINDFAIDEMVTVAAGKELTIDLNGKTITGTDNTSKNFSIIDNRGNLTIKDSSAEKSGKITLTATIDSDWGRYSAVIANNPGGKLTIDGGTLEHLGGTDMAYGIDNLTNGKGTYAETVINGGTIKSTYRGIRQFLNGIEAQNILTINGGTVEGANKSVWMQDPSANANTGTLTIAEGAKLVGDAYLSVTAGSTEWPVEVSIAAAALQGESKVVTSNVPAGYELAKINNTYSVALASDLSASINGIGYITLAEAITAAQPGDVIKFLKDINESVTINKNVTIDGADKQYTGTMTGNAGQTITVQNVNFVNGGFAKTTKSTTGNYTFKECTFDGAKTYAYPLSFRGANTINVENCIVKDYLYSFLYVTSGTNAVSVKNVTVEDCPSYAVYFSSGVNSATFENLTVKNSNNGFVINNTANRAFTIKDCKMENVTTAINYSGGTNTITCTALGVNDFGTAALSEYAVIKGATITDTNYYGSVKGMVEKAETGDTVKLLSNITLKATGYEMASCDGYPSFVHVEGKAITVDLNGKTIKANVDTDDVSNFVIGVFSTDNGGELTLVDNSTEGTGTVKLEAAQGKAYSLLCNYEDGCKMTINGGTYKATKVIDCLVYSGGTTDALVTVNDGNFTLDNLGQDPNPSNAANGRPWIFNVKGAGDHYVLVNGGKFNADINRQHWSNEVYVAKECYTVANADGTYTVNYGAVAYVNEGMLTGPYFVRKNVGYATLGEAFAAADDGDTVTLLKNIEYDMATGFINGEYVDGLVYTGDKSFTVDFNGKKVTDDGCVNDYLIYINNKGEKASEITFTNGTIVSKNGCWSAVCVNSSAATQNVVLNLNGMNITNSNDAEYSGNPVVRVRNLATVNVNDKTVITSNGASYGVAANTDGSTLNINEGATIVQQNSGTTGGNSVFAAVGGKGVINIKGGTITSDKYGVHTMTTGTPVINISGGTITAPVALKSSTNGGNGELATINVTGGTINGTLETYTENGKIVVSDGVFDRPVLEEFCAEGYAPLDNEDGTYGVYNAVIDEVNFVDGQFTEHNYSRNMTVGKLTYERNGIPTTWTTFYVPFEVPVSQLAELGIEVAYINGVRRDDKNFDGKLDEFAMEVIYIHGGNADGSEKTLKANYPYFIRSKGSERKDLYIELYDALLYAAKNATYDCSTFTEKFEITGTVATTEVNSSDNADKYIISGGEWSRRTIAYNLAPFRFYMTVTSRDGNGPIKDAPASLSIVVRGEELPDGTTLIYDINAETGDNVIYDLNGRRVLETEKGNIYIINGKKVLVK